MKISKLHIACFLAGFSFVNLFAQDASISISENDKISKLLSVKTEMTKNNEIQDRFKIQLFYGNNGEANNVIQEYRNLFEYASEIVYESPNYKVWVGNFRNRLEADRALLKIKESFPSAFIPKPTRK